MSRSFPVKGTRELDAFLSALPKNMQRNAYGAGLRAAGKVIETQAQANAPKKSGKMAVSIKAGSVHANKDGTFSIYVRAAGAKQKGNDHAFIAFFHEFGVAPHFITAGDRGISARLLTRAGKKEGIDVVARRGKRRNEREVLAINGNLISGALRHPGHAAHPFLRPALDMKADEALQAFAAKIRAYLEGKTGLDLSIDEAA